MGAPRWLQSVRWLPLVLVVAGVVVAAASETAGSVLVLTGALGQVGIAAVLWSNPGLFSNDLGLFGFGSRRSPRATAAILIAISVFLIVLSIARLA